MTTLLPPQIELIQLFGLIGAGGFRSIRPDVQPSHKRLLASQFVQVTRVDNEQRKVLVWGVLENLAGERV
jgi:hypothetical protein